MTEESTLERRGAAVTDDRRDNLEHPVKGLHRTRGSFATEARSRAPLVAGEPMRFAAFAAGALALVALGAGLAAALRRPRRAIARSFSRSWR